MAIRFAGSRAPQIPDFGGKSGQTPTFAPMSFASGGVASNAGAAADAVSLGRAFGAIRKNSPNYQGIVQDAASINSSINQAITAADANIATTKIGAAGLMDRAEMTADMYNKQAKAAEKGGTMSLIGGIAGGAISLLTGGIL